MTEGDIFVWAFRIVYVLFFIAILLRLKEKEANRT